MEKLCDIVEFLSKYANNESCLFSFIFGSVAKGNNHPNDCDLFWTTKAYPETKEWNEMKVHIEEMRNIFFEKFNLKLNVLINTVDEFMEGSEFKSRILNRPRIMIKNGSCRIEKTFFNMKQ